MAKVVPSTVCGAIDSLKISASAGWNHLMIAMTLLPSIDEIPDELIVLDSTELVAFNLAVEGLRVLWQKSLAGHPVPPANEYLIFPGFPGHDPVAVIRQLLGKCPDEAPGQAPGGLAFIPDPELRASILGDLGAAQRALSNAEWKAATVLAGSAIEALLLWKIQEQQTATGNANLASQAFAAPGAHPPGGTLERWDLSDLIQVVGHYRWVSPETVTETTLARNFRNLIHPGRTLRLGTICDSGTAHEALAALYHVIRDLTHP